MNLIEGAKTNLFHWHGHHSMWAKDTAHSDEQMADMGRQVGVTALHWDHNRVHTAQNEPHGKWRARVSLIQRSSSCD